VKPQLRAYTLVVGRNNDDQPFRKLMKYDGPPIKGVTDYYRLMSPPELLGTERRVEDLRERCERALQDIREEKMDRLARKFGASRVEEIEGLMRDD
jgi:hypothetical protein